MIIIKKTWLYLTLTLLVFNLSGCSTIPGQQATKPTEDLPTKPGAILNTSKGWHEVRFRIAFPQDKDAEKPRWYMGGLLANEVINPVLDKHRSEIDLWRFHRRSGPKFGHVFSFYFYSPATTAARIHQEVQSNALLKQLQQQKQITWLGLNDLNQNTKPEIKDTSDDSWSLIMQKNWPSFIMGVSQNWLDLTHEISKDHHDIKDLHKRYQKVSEVITGIWEREGKHAYLHHLNGIFAYQPMYIRF